MNSKDKDILCRLIRDHEDLLGASRTALLALEAFMASIERLKCAPEQIKELYLELAEAIKSTRPRIIPLIHLIEQFEQEMQPHFNGDLEKVRQKAIAILQAKHARLKAKVGKIIELGMGCIEPGDTIIVHTASLDVVNMLILAHQVMGKNIKVIVLKQDFIKTRKIIKALGEADMDPVIVPEYAMGHYVQQADKMFVGALSITHDDKAVTAVGTANIVSLCHYHKIPVYLFANTLKFSHLPSQDQQIHTKMVEQVQDQCSYRLTVYSHDMLDLDMVDFLVTENGVYPKEKIAAVIAAQHKTGA